MDRSLTALIASKTMILTGCFLTCLAQAQVAASQSVISSVPAVTTTTTNQRGDNSAENPDATIDPASLLPDLPKLAPQKASLVGGTIEKMDRVRDQFTLRIFGAGKMKIAFDPRTRIFRDGKPASASDLHQGDRIYVDTILDGSTVFARNIRLRNALSAREIHGVVASYRPDTGELELRDALFPQPITMRLAPDARLIHGANAATVAELKPGTLVVAQVDLQPNGRNLAQQIAILAMPGTSFTFAGRIVSLDLSGNLLVLLSPNGKTYEIHLDPAVVPVEDSLHESADVTVQTRFDGSRYEAQRVTLNPQTQP